MPSNAFEICNGFCAECFAALERRAEAERMHLCLLQKRERLEHDAALNQEDLAGLKVPPYRNGKAGTLSSAVLHAARNVTPPRRM